MKCLTAITLYHGSGLIFMCEKQKKSLKVEMDGIALLRRPLTMPVETGAWDIHYVLRTLNCIVCCYWVRWLRTVKRRPNLALPHISKLRQHQGFDAELLNLTAAKTDECWHLTSGTKRTPDHLSAPTKGHEVRTLVRTMFCLYEGLYFPINVSKRFSTQSAQFLANIKLASS